MVIELIKQLFCKFQLVLFLLKGTLTTFPGIYHNPMELWSSTGTQQLMEGIIVYNITKKNSQTLISKKQSPGFVSTVWSQCRPGLAVQTGSHSCGSGRLQESG